MTIETLGDDDLFRAEAAEIGADTECAVVHIAESSSSHVEKLHDVGS